MTTDPIAQLEERYLDVVEVTGSSPVGITILKISGRPQK